MLNQAQVTTQHTTFLAPVVPVTADLPIHEIPYSSSLLLSLPDLSSALVCDVEFVHACQYGYDDYFEEMIELLTPVDENTVVDENTYEFLFTYKAHTSAEVYAFILDNVRPEATPLANDATSLPWRVGFLFGWLSALSKYQPMMAKVGVQVLCSLARDLEHDKHNRMSLSVVAQEQTQHPVKQTFTLGTYWE